jgi:gas vesicle structural protein
LTKAELKHRQEKTMNVERASAANSLIDVLDRVLDKGIVIDAWVRVSLVGIDLITIEARVTVASFETWLKYAPVLGKPTPVTTTIKSVTSQGIQVQLADRVPGSATAFADRRARVRRKSGLTKTSSWRAWSRHVAGYIASRETAGIELLVNGIAMAHRDDEARLVRACATLDELYEYYKRKRPDRVRWTCAW